MLIFDIKKNVQVRNIFSLYPVGKSARLYSIGFPLRFYYNSQYIFLGADEPNEHRENYTSPMMARYRWIDRSVKPVITGQSDES